jgi:hypothetical protein
VLEDEADFAGELRAPGDERARDREQRRRVAVVAAGVHDAVRTGRKLEAALLADRQGIKVGAQSQRPPGMVAVQPRHDARVRRPFEV